MSFAQRIEVHNPAESSNEIRKFCLSFKMVSMSKYLEAYMNNEYICFKNNTAKIIVYIEESPTNLDSIFWSRRKMTTFIYWISCKVSMEPNVTGRNNGSMWLARILERQATFHCLSVF